MYFLRIQNYEENIKKQIEVEMQDIFAQIKQEDLTEDLQMVASSCGIETVRNLLRNCAGMSIYVPRISRLDHFIMRYIRESRGKSFKQIASELGVSEQYIKRLFKSMR